MAHRVPPCGEPLPRLQRGPDGRRRWHVPEPPPPPAGAFDPAEVRQTFLVRGMYLVIQEVRATPDEAAGALRAVLAQIAPLCMTTTEEIHDVD